MQAVFILILGQYSKVVGKSVLLLLIYLVLVFLSVFAVVFFIQRRRWKEEIVLIFNQKVGRNEFCVNLRSE